MTERPPRASEPFMPSEISHHLGRFDRFAEKASDFASRAWFFCSCLALVILWLPSILLIRSVDTWQLIINTLTTIVTFLSVALLQNSQMRANLAVQHKLNAIAQALGDLMEQDRRPDDAEELHDAVDLEAYESTSQNRETTGDDPDPDQDVRSP
ncbi:low affinity iron permease family protein [Leucobacter luti]|uniref:low affinity iron permease family protein n=1 Tax=Leucobacter luti TaxID=340320 RepID=UPI003CFE0645